MELDGILTRYQQPLQKSTMTTLLEGGNDLWMVQPSSNVLPQLPIFFIKKIRYHMFTTILCRVAQKLLAFSKRSYLFPFFHFSPFSFLFGTNRWYSSLLFLFVFLFLMKNKKNQMDFTVESRISGGRIEDKLENFAMGTKLMKNQRTRSQQES